MTKVLYVSAADRISTEGFHWALHVAKSSDRLIRLVYVRGDEASEVMEKNIADWERQCRSFLIKFEVQREEGSYEAACLKAGNESETATMVVIEKKKKGWGKGDVVSSQLQGKIQCEMKVYPAD